MTWTNIQQLLIERYLPLVEENVSNVVNYSVDLFYRYVHYQITINWLTLAICLISLIAVPLIIRHILKKNKALEDDSYYNKSDKQSNRQMWYLMGGLALIVIVMCASYSVTQLLWYYFVPEIQVYKSLTQ